MDLKNLSRNIYSKGYNVTYKRKINISSHEIKHFFNKLINIFKSIIRKIKIILNKNKYLKYIIMFILLASIISPISYYSIKYYKSEKLKRDTITVEIEYIKSFESRGSRDNNKIEKKEFLTTSPIQLNFKFKEAEKGTVILCKIYKDNSDYFNVEIPLEGEGDRYVSLSNGMKNPKGTYKVEISQKGYILKTYEFKVID